MLAPLYVADITGGIFAQYALDYPPTSAGLINYDRYGMIFAAVAAADRELDFRAFHSQPIQSWKFALSFDIMTNLIDAGGNGYNVPWRSKGLTAVIPGESFIIGSASYISFLGHLQPFWGVGTAKGVFPSSIGILGDRESPQVPLPIIPVSVEFTGRIFFDFELYIK